MECTEAGRSLMQNRAAGGLSAKERQVILLATGSLQSRKLLRAMGDEGVQILRNLTQRGLLRPTNTNGQRADRASAFQSTGFADSRFDTRESQFADSRFLDSQLQEPSGFGASRFSPSGFGMHAAQRPAAAPQTAVPQAPVPAAAPPASRPVAAPAAVAPSAPPAVPAAAPAAPKPAARNSKRSLAASKMYMIDMLQLLRCMDASALAVDIQTSHSETDLVDNIARGAEYFATATNASYAGKVYAKLQDILPEEHLGRLQLAV
ncbi:MAG: hypothetical protein Q4G39_01715 [Brachymonas sp.]|nr:hypothetical protein [Brachymonas sp.]